MSASVDKGGEESCGWKGDHYDQTDDECPIPRLWGLESSARNESEAEYHQWHVAIHKIASRLTPLPRFADDGTFDRVPRGTMKIYSSAETPIRAKSSSNWSSEL
jgi:hypothetical protein